MTSFSLSGKFSNQFKEIKPFCSSTMSKRVFEQEIV